MEDPGLRCEVCGRLYQPGEEIRATWVDGDLVVVHLRCARARVEAVVKQPSESDDTEANSAPKESEKTAG